MERPKAARQRRGNIVYTWFANSWLNTRRFYSSASVYQQASYGYDNVGNLTSVTYPSGTPNLSFSYDALNRMTSMVDGVGTTAFTYNAWGGLASEACPWASDTATYGYNAARQRTSLTLQQPAGNWSQTYSYDGAHRMTQVTSPAGTFGYQYSTGGSPAPASRLWVQLNLPNSGKIVQVYDSRARLTSTELRNNLNATLNRHEYLYDNRHQRTNHVRIPDGSSVAYSYDNLGQLKTAGRM